MSETRSKQFILARPETRLLEWIARRLPARVMYGRLGPTEARLLLIALNTLLALGVASFAVLDVLGVGLAGAMIAALVGRAARNLKRLSELEPA